MSVGSSPAGATLGESGEFSLIAMITSDLPTSPEILVGPGDDAAVLRVDGPVLTSVDVLVEGVHFRRDWSSAAEVGRKAVAVNVADIEAMGGRAFAVVVGLSAPGELPLAWALELAEGIRTEGERSGVVLVGGDVTRSRDVTISVTVFGALDGRDPVRRSGAGPEQVVALVGRTGWAAAGMAVLQRGFRSPRAVVEAQRVPEVAYGQGAVAADAGATAMIDVSDGLLADLGHLASASGITVDLDLATFEVPDVLQAVAAATGKDPYVMLLTGGEDHALAACFPDAGAVPDGWRVIGRTRAVAEGGTAGVLVDGSVWEGPTGWDHFGGAR
ncbi:MAG TPA: thiamine-phosphate kinase [Microlunatus sp.]|nr:thiamine-phosphate kinase [Microlunatus sp.]